MSRFHFLFEQSGTFKKAAIKLGHEAYDYDIVKTENVDFQVDLLWHLETFFSDVFEDKDNIFYDIGKNDIVFAFFPCTYFSGISFLPLYTSWRNYSGLTLSQKLEAIYSRASLRHKYYGHFLTLFQIAAIKGFKLVVENPWTSSFLRQNAPFKPQIIHNDRSEFGDVLKKPTAYWCLNWTPSVLDMPCHYKDVKGNICHLDKGISRSLIDFDYALNFISHYFGEVE